MKAAILFDFGGTLDYPAHWLDRFLYHYKAAGLELDRATLDRAFTVATGMAYRSHDDMRELRLEATIDYLASLQIKELAASEGRVAASIDAIGRECLAVAVSRSFAHESRDGLAASRVVLERLAGRYTLGVVSNFYGNLDRILDQAGMLQLFDFIGDSSRCGSFKPDPGMFRAALRELQAEPHLTLMAGDSLDKDCAPARGLGMRTAWLRHRSAPLEPRLAAYADFTIGALAELEHLSWIES